MEIQDAVKEIAPAQAAAGLAISSAEKADRPPGPLRRFVRLLGPGFITGASDDDPSGIGTYAVAGASLGYATLWTAVVTFPLMAAVQLICARVGLVSGMGLAGVLRRHYPRWLLYAAIVALVVANTINAGADMGAIAATIRLLMPVPTVVLVPAIALLILGAQIGCSYRVIERVFKWLTLSLLAYIGAALLARPDWGQVLKATFIPEFRADSQYLAMLVALLGTTISPYLFFWQASEEVEEERCTGRGTLLQDAEAARQELRNAAWDVNLGMFFSNLVMYFIILATAATLFRAGKTDIQSATDAAEALRPLAGNAASLLLALGLIGSGFLAVPILTGSAAYAVAEAFSWKSGLDEKPAAAKRFYAVIAASTVCGMLMDFLNINPIQALYWTAIINGFLAPPLLVLTMLVSSNREVMGERVNGPVLNVLGWLTTIIMAAAAIALGVTSARG